MKQKFIPLSVPYFKGNELEYVSNAIHTEWVSTGGAYVVDFETKVSNYVDSKGAVACQSGTAGLHVALRVLDINQEHEVIVPALTFIAAVNPVKYVCAEPIFMDCDDSLNMDADKLLEFCLKKCTFENNKLVNNKSKKHIKAIIVVHIFGNMADMYKIIQVAKQFNLKVIEDATEAIGTYYTDGPYKNKYAGTIGDIGVFSFNGNKIITTGGGGIIVSNDKELLEKAKHLTTQAKSDELYYKHDEIGYNYRMTNLQAALGVAQIEQLDKFIDIKKENYLLYKEKITSIKGLSLIGYKEDIRPNYWFYAMYIDKDYLLNRDELISWLSQNNIQTRPIWDLICNQIPYQRNEVYNLEKAKDYLKNVINIPCSCNLQKNDLLFISKCLENPQKGFI